MEALVGKFLDEMSKSERNATKLRLESERLRKGMVPHWTRFWKLHSGDVGHAYMNLYTEARRISPYYTGHYDGIYYTVSVPLQIILIGLLIWRW
jgi:hypothetical protein